MERVAAEEIDVASKNKTPGRQGGLYLRVKSFWDWSQQPRT